MRTAVVLFNLGGPDGPEAVEPFLFNLFNDPAIIGAPGPIRWLLAKLISRRRAPVAREIYAEIGGRSPLLPLTEDQASVLASACGDLGEVQAFVCMRYWHPMSDEAAKSVKAFAPDKIVLLPLYPQYSTTTSGSSLKDWHRAAKSQGLDTVPTTEVCCYPDIGGWVSAQASLIRHAYGPIADSKPRVLFSAHGLPKKVIDGGDPYQWQVELTSKAVADALAIEDLDWIVCYQSRVGPLEWIGPSTEEEIARAGRDGKSLIVVPIAFVSEHSETLVELDIEYAELAKEKGVPAYVRVPAVAVQSDFIGALTALVRRAVHSSDVRISGGDGRICPQSCTRCAWTA